MLKKSKAMHSIASNNLQLLDSAWALAFQLRNKTSTHLQWKRAQCGQEKTVSLKKNVLWKAELDTRETEG